MEDLIERIDNACADARYWASQGTHPERQQVVLLLEDCTALSELLSAAYRAVLTGKRDEALADNLTLLSDAFAADEED